MIEELLKQDATDREKLVQTYYALCDARDQVNARVASVQIELDAAIARTQAARAEELELAAQIEAIWGPNWIPLKKRIAELAQILKKIPPRG